MKLSVEQKDSGIVILRFSEDLNYQQAALIREKLDEVCKEKPGAILIDLRNVPYLDSSAIAAFVELSQKTRALQAKLIFFGLTDSVREIFEMAKLHLFFTIAAT